MAETSNFDKLLQKTLSQESVDPSLLKELLQIEANRTSTPLEVQLAKLNASNERRKPWYQWIPWAGFFTITGGILSAVITSSFDYAGNNEVRNHELRLETQRYESSVFDRLLIIDELPPNGNEEEERRKRVCFAVRFGLIKVPEYFIVSSPDDREDYRNDILEFIEGYNCIAGDIPANIPAPEYNPTNDFIDSTVSCPIPTLQVVRNRLSIPDDIDVDPSQNERILSASLQELNRGVHEVCDSSRVADYWNSVGLELDGSDRQIPWSAAFTSWIIAETGNTLDLRLSGETIKIWRSAIARDTTINSDTTFIPSEKEAEPGDIIFLTRSSIPIDMETIRTATDGPRIRAHSGIVYSNIDGEIIYISGNARDMVSQTRILTTDEQIIGYIRH